MSYLMNRNQGRKLQKQLLKHIVQEGEELSSRKLICGDESLQQLQLFIEFDSASTCDVTKKDDIENLVREIEKSEKHVDLLSQ